MTHRGCRNEKCFHEASPLDCSMHDGVQLAYELATSRTPAN